MRLCQRVSCVILAASIAPLAAAHAKKADVPEKHRAAAIECVQERGTFKGQPRKGLAGCKSDAACKRGKSGRCLTSLMTLDHSGGPLRNECSYDACFTDADCGDKRACICGRELGAPAGTHRCVAAQCRTDADCGARAYCSPSPGPCGSSDTGYYCHGAKDECTNDSDCTPPNASGDTATQCTYSAPLLHWVCTTASCPIG